MFNKYDYEDLKLAKEYLEETEDYNIYYYDQIRNDNNELIISGYIVLRRKWYSKELYIIEFDYNFDKKEFYSIIPSEFYTAIRNLELTEDNTIFTKDELLIKTQKYINDALYDLINIKKYKPSSVFKPDYSTIFKRLEELSKEDELFVWKLELKEED